MNLCAHLPEFWTPEQRRRGSERTREGMRLRYADPTFRQRMGFLQAHERDAIVADARTGRRYIEIGLDWLISEARVSQIARAAGIRRHHPHASQLRAQEGG